MRASQALPASAETEYFLTLDEEPGLSHFPLPFRTSCPEHCLIHFPPDLWLTGIVVTTTILLGVTARLPEFITALLFLPLRCCCLSHRQPRYSVVFLCNVLAGAECANLGAEFWGHRQWRPGDVHADGPAVCQGFGLAATDGNHDSGAGLCHAQASPIVVAMAMGKVSPREGVRLCVWLAVLNALLLLPLNSLWFGVLGYV